MATIPLRATPTQVKEVDSRFECARLLYNACLRVALDRARAMWADPEWERAVAMPRVMAGEPNPARARAFRALRARHGFGEWDLKSVGSGLRVGWLREHVGAQEAQVLGARAHDAVNHWVLGQRGKPRFKSTGHGLHSLACSDLHGALRVSADGSGLQWGAGFVLPFAFDHAGAWKETFCAELGDKAKQLRRLNRQLDRQHRAGSPACFDEQGRHRKDGCQWRVRSRRAQRTQVGLSEVHRRLASHRRSLHGNLVNRVLGQGQIIHTEKLSYQALQRRFGRSVGRRAPGMFIATLSRKAASAGGTVELVDTWTTRLSQSCICGTVAKKPLSQRTHRCGCGVEADRDLFSAFLVRHVDPRVHPHLLDVDGARRALPMLQDSGAGRRRAVSNRRVPQALPVGYGFTRQSRSANSPQSAADARKGEAA